MGNYKRISVRLNLERMSHQKAWAILQSLPHGRMNEYITNSILTADDQMHLKDMIVESMLEVMENYEPKQAKQEMTKNIDNGALDFINNL